MIKKRFSSGKEGLEVNWSSKFDWQMISQKNGYLRETVWYVPPRNRAGVIYGHLAGTSYRAWLYGVWLGISLERLQIFRASCEHSESNYAARDDLDGAAGR